MSDLINGREMLKRYQEDLCYDIACKDCSMCTEDGGCRVEEWIDKFPSADRPQGEWVDAEIPLESGDTMPIQVCNLCKTFYPLAYTGGGHRFCPNCGARMLKGADDE